MARRATYIKEQRAHKGEVLVLDAGNSISSNTGPAQETQGRVIVEAMNMMGYDAMTLGYLDVLLGPDELQQRMEEADFPFLSANLVNAKTNEPFAEPYVLIQRGSHTIAIIGATSGSTAATLPSAPGQSVELRIDDPIPALERVLETVRDQADIIILLSHLGMARDREISMALPGIDVIIGGYTRSVQVPTQFDDPGPIIAQAGYRGEWIGWVDVTFDAEGNPTRFEGNSEELTDKYGEDAEMKRYVEKIKGE